MAKYKMCSVLDMVAEQYGRPFFALSEASATRSLADEINATDNPSTLNQHPADFQLFLLGEFDDTTGVIQLEAVPRLLATGAQLCTAFRHMSPAQLSEAKLRGNAVGIVHPDEDSRNG